jgi:hypothetical protein
MIDVMNRDNPHKGGGQALIEMLKAVPQSPCETGECGTRKYKACEKNINRECYAFYEYINSNRGKYDPDNIGRMRKER